MGVRFASAAIAVTVWLTPVSSRIVSGHQQQPTRFTSSVNMLAVDVRVVDDSGQPILGLLPGDFTVSINRHERRVVSADLVQYANDARPLLNIAPLTRPASGTVPDNNRVFVLAVDTASFSTGGIKPAIEAAQRFVANLRPNDIVGLYVYPYERPNLDLTHDHRVVRDALANLIGRREDQLGQYHLSPAEVVDINAGDREALDRVVAAECPVAPGQPPDVGCPSIISAEASMAASYYEAEASERLYSLEVLLRDLGRLQGRKTVVVVSGGLLNATRAGARPNVQSFMTELGEMAARSNVGTYVVHIDDTFLNAFSVAARPSRRAIDQARSVMADESAFADGLIRLASETGGTYLPVKAGTGDFAFGRVLRETMAYYLLGVEPAPEDFDGRKLVVQVKTSAKGATVRALREVIAR
jgi:VWFA-related protein